jgi:hypothetical protein
MCRRRDRRVNVLNEFAPRGVLWADAIANVTSPCKTPVGEARYDAARMTESAALEATAISKRSKKTLWRAIACAAVLAMAACGSSPITSARIEDAIAPTFANLVQLQVSRLGLPPMARSDFDVLASCRRTVGAPNSGSGDWICTLLWKGPDRRPLRDTYDLFVTTEGCYTATVEGESLGGPMLKATNGSSVRNLLYVFEGCFDTT